MEELLKSKILTEDDLIKLFNDKYPNYAYDIKQNNWYFINDYNIHEKVDITIIKKVFDNLLLCLTNIIEKELVMNENTQICRILRSNKSIVEMSETNIYKLIFMTKNDFYTTFFIHDKQKNTIFSFKNLLYDFDTSNFRKININERVLQSQVCDYNYIQKVKSCENNLENICIKKIIHNCLLKFNENVFNYMNILNTNNKIMLKIIYLFHNLLDYQNTVLDVLKIIKKCLLPKKYFFNPPQNIYVYRPRITIINPDQSDYETTKIFIEILRTLLGPYCVDICQLSSYDNYHGRLLICKNLDFSLRKINNDKFNMYIFMNENENNFANKIPYNKIIFSNNVNIKQNTILPKIINKLSGKNKCDKYLSCLFDLVVSL